MGLEIRWLFLGFVSASFTLEVAAGKADEPRPKYGPAATRLFHSREYLRKHDAPDFWALMPYYTAQRNDRSCSLASAVMVVNAARAHRVLRANEQLIMQSLIRLNSLCPHKGTFSWGNPPPQTGPSVLPAASVAANCSSERWCGAACCAPAASSPSIAMLDAP